MPSTEAPDIALAAVQALHWFDVEQSSAMARVVELKRPSNALTAKRFGVPALRDEEALLAANLRWALASAIDPAMQVMLVVCKGRRAIV